MTEPISRDDVKALLEAYSPPSWKPHARGIVFLGNNDEEARWMQNALMRWATADGFVRRMPHHTVSAAALTGLATSELDRAVGGILILQPFSDFDEHGLYNVNKRVERERLPVVVVGIDALSWHGREDPGAYLRRLQDRAATAGLVIVTLDDLERLDEAPQPATGGGEALAQINAHRRRLGMPDLDPATAGWTEEDVRIEAERVARLPNPLAVAPDDPVLREMASQLESALLEEDLEAVEDLLDEAAEFYGPDARETRALHVLVRSHGVLANPSVVELKRRLMP